MEVIMKTVTLGIATRDTVTTRFLSAMKGKSQGAYITFESPEQLFQTLTQMRWNLIQVITGEGPLSIREISRRVGRDVKAVHRDVHALLDAGILERDESGVSFPYDAVHVDFLLKGT
jgi:predicted transcriptional regulator